MFINVFKKPKICSNVPMYLFRETDFFPGPWSYSRKSMTSSSSRCLACLWAQRCSMTEAEIRHFSWNICFLSSGQYLLAEKEREHLLPITDFSHLLPLILCLWGYFLPLFFVCFFLLDLLDLGFVFYCSVWALSEANNLQQNTGLFPVRHDRHFSACQFQSAAGACSLFLCSLLSQFGCQRWDQPRIARAATGGPKTNQDVESCLLQHLSSSPYDWQGQGIEWNGTEYLSWDVYPWKILVTLRSGMPTLTVMQPRQLCFHWRGIFFDRHQPPAHGTLVFHLVWRTCHYAYPTKAKELGREGYCWNQDLNLQPQQHDSSVLTNWLHQCC